MARGINKVILIGYLGAQPEVRQLKSGVHVTNISVATTSFYRDKQSSKLQERTEWHRVVFFNRLADIVGNYLTKGSKVYVEGSLRTRKWQDNSKTDRYVTEIIANEMQMLDSKNSHVVGCTQENNASMHNASGQHNSADEDIPF